MEVKTLKRGFFQRLFGISASKPPRDAGCWSVTDHKLVIDLDRAVELSEPGVGIRLEGDNLGKRVLVFKTGEGKYYAFYNACGHAGRRLDPVPGTDTVQCCSVGKSTYNLNGEVLSGSSTKSVEPLEVEETDGKLIVHLSK